jgi:hypothetical protein
MRRWNMALADTALPYGLREVELTPIADDGTEGTPVKLPNSQTFSFEEAEEFTELRGDDRLVAVRGSGPSVNFDLAAGGISLAAYKVLTGGAVTEDGTTPETIRKFTKKSTDSRPYFKVRGRAISDSGGDLVCTLPKCRVTGSLSGSFEDGEFFVSECDGQAMGATLGEEDDVVYVFEQRETAASLSS